MLVISDLHFEKASHFAQKGQFAPPYDTGKTLEKIEALQTCFNPKRVISLGDSFHDDHALQRMLPQDITRLRALVQKQDWVWVAGNHDEGQASLDGAPALHEYETDGFIFRHEPANVAETALYEISGHLHPCATIKQRSRHLRRRCFVFDAHRLIMPALGAFTGSLNVRDAAYGALFAQQKPDVILLGDMSAHRFPYTACLKAR